MRARQLLSHNACSAGRIVLDILTLGLLGWRRTGQLQLCFPPFDCAVLPWTLPPFFFPPFPLPRVSLRGSHV